MNDYLSNLSARSLGLTDDISLVSPRVRSFFEPLQEVWGVPVEAPLRSSLLNDRGNDGIPPAPLGELGEEPTSLEQATERYRGIDTAAPRDLHTVKILQTSAKPSDNRLFAPSDNMNEEVATKETPVTSVEQPVPTPRGKTGLFSSQARREEWSAQPLNGSDKEQLAADDIRMERRAERVIGRAASSGEEALEQHGTISALLEQSFQNPIEPILTPLQSPGHRENPVRPEPTIQVTIGRIEVRATTAPVQNRPKPKAPSMSLDEYLRQRSGERR